MRFSPGALLVFVAFCVLLMVALSSGSTSGRIAGAVATVIIAIGLSGNALRGRHRARTHPTEQQR